MCDVWVTLSLMQILQQEFTIYFKAFNMKYKRFYTVYIFDLKRILIANESASNKSV